MIHLPETLKAWQSPSFKEIAKNEINRLDGKMLPLQKGLTMGSHAREDKFSVVILGVEERADIIGIKAGIFYSSVIAGCSCADDPTPEDELTEYCELLFEVNRETAETKVELIN